MTIPFKTQSITLHKNLPGRPWKVLRQITRVEDFPKYMPNVKRCSVIQRCGGGAQTEWLVDVDGLRIRWKQKDTVDIKNFKVHFQAIEGDLDEFEGTWALSKGQGESTDVTLSVKARLGLPLVERAVDDILDVRLRKNFQTMLDAMEENLIQLRYRRSLGQFSPEVKGFAVMGHPYNFQHLLRFFKFLKPDINKMSPEFLEKLFEITPAYKGQDISGFKSAAGTVVDGSFILCPIIPDMMKFNSERVFEKVVEGCKVAEHLGAGVLALGGFTSIVGEKYFDKLIQRVRMPITTGNTFTTAMALAGVRKACGLMGIDMAKSRAVIIGGTGDIGSACARALVREVKELIVTGRTPSSVKDMEKELKRVKAAKVSGSLDNNGSAKKADIIIAAASSSQSVVDINLIKPGAVVCDVGYPKNISYTSKGRKDIFVFSGGLCTVPAAFDLGFDIGLPAASVLYGCFAEAVILSLEKRFENYSLGKGKIQPDKITEIQAMGEKHGFVLAPFYWGDELIDEKTVGLAQTRG